MRINKKIMILAAAIAAVLFWILTRKKHSQDPDPDDIKAERIKTVTKKFQGGGGGSFGGSGAGGSW